MRAAAANALADVCNAQTNALPTHRFSHPLIKLHMEIANVKDTFVEEEEESTFVMEMVNKLVYASAQVPRRWQICDEHVNSIHAALCQNHSSGQLRRVVCRMSHLCRCVSFARCLLNVEMGAFCRVS